MAIISIPIWPVPPWSEGSRNPGDQYPHFGGYQLSDELIICEFLASYEDIFRDFAKKMDKHMMEQLKEKKGRVE